MTDALARSRNGDEDGANGRRWGWMDGVSPCEGAESSLRSYESNLYTPNTILIYYFSNLFNLLVRI